MNSTNKSNRTTTKPEKIRKSLIEQQTEVQIRDPGAQAKHQVSELDKNVHSSIDKKHRCNAELQRDADEISHIDEQINRLLVRYEPLCVQLEEKKTRRDQIQETLSKCINVEKGIMEDSKSRVHGRRIEDAKLLRKQSTLELQLARGYDLSLQSTFHQKRSDNSNQNTKMSATFNRTANSTLSK